MGVQLYTPKNLTWHLKMDGWNTSFLLGWPIIRCELLVSRRVHGVIPPTSFSPQLPIFLMPFIGVKSLNLWLLGPILQGINTWDPFLGGNHTWCKCMVILQNITLIVACFGLVSYNDSPASEQVDHGFNERLRVYPFGMSTVFILLVLF